MANNGGKPVQISGSTTYQPGDLSPEQIFPVEVSYSGKMKVQNYPDGSSGAAFPDLRVTVTNLTSHEAFEFVSTGHNRVTTLDDGTTVGELNGRNVTADPFDPGNGTGLWLTAGHYNFAFEPNGDLVPLNGHGLLVDIIELF